MKRFSFIKVISFISVLLPKGTMTAETSQKYISRTNTNSLFRYFNIMLLATILNMIAVSAYADGTNPAKADGLDFFLLHPQSKIEITLHDVCRIIENQSAEAVAYIPTATKDVWEHFESRTDTTGHHAIEVTPCE